MKQPTAKKILSKLLAAIMVISMLPLSSMTALAAMPDYTSNPGGRSFLIYTYKGLKECLSKDLSEGDATHAPIYEFKLMNDITFTSSDSTDYLGLTGKRVYSIDLNGYNLSVTTHADRLFSVKQNASLAIIGNGSNGEPGSITFQSDMPSYNNRMIYLDNGLASFHGGNYESIYDIVSAHKAEYDGISVYSGAKFTSRESAVFSGKARKVDLTNCELYTQSNHAPVLWLYDETLTHIGIGENVVLKRDDFGNLIYAPNSTNGLADIYLKASSAVLDGRQLGASLSTEKGISGQKLEFVKRELAYKFEDLRNLKFSVSGNTPGRIYDHFITNFVPRFGDGFGGYVSIPSDNSFSMLNVVMNGRVAQYDNYIENYFSRLSEYVSINPDTLQGYMPLGTPIYVCGWYREQSSVTGNYEIYEDVVEEYRTRSDHYLPYYTARSTSAPEVVKYSDGRFVLSCTPAKVNEEKCSALYEYAVVIGNSTDVYAWNSYKGSFEKASPDSRGYLYTWQNAVRANDFISSDAFVDLGKDFLTKAITAMENISGTPKISFVISPVAEYQRDGKTVRTRDVPDITEFGLADLRALPTTALPTIQTINVTKKTDLNSNWKMQPGNSLSDYDFELVPNAADNDDIASITTSWTEFSTNTSTDVPSSTIIGNHERYYATVTVTAKDGYVFDTENSRLYYGENASGNTLSRLVSDISLDGKTATFVLSQTKYWSDCNHSIPNTWEYSSLEHWKKCSICGEKLQIADHTLQDKQINGEACKYCAVCGYTYTIGQIYSISGVVIRQLPYAYGSIIPTNTMENIHCYYGGARGSLKSIEWYRSADSSLGTRVYAGDLFENGYNYYAKVTIQSDDLQLTFDSDTKISWEYSNSVNAEKVGEPIIGSNGYTMTQTFKVPLREVAEIDLTIPKMYAGQDVEQYVRALLDSYSYNDTGSGTIGRASVGIYAPPLPGESYEQIVCYKTYFNSSTNTHNVLVSTNHSTFQAGTKYRIEIEMGHLDRSYDEDHFNLQNAHFLDTPDLEYKKDACTANNTTFSVYYTPDAQAEGNTTVSGSFQSFGDATNGTTIKLFAQSASTTKFIATKTGNTGSYSFSNVPTGIYRLEVSKANHVTREYTVTVGSDAVTQDVVIWLKGDVTGDGEIKSNDAAQIDRYYAGKTSMLVNGDENAAYRMLVADITGDGDIKSNDAAQIDRYYAGKTSLISS